MATQTGSIDLTASNDAAKTATSYVTEVTGQNGIMVHPSTDDDTGVRVTSDVDILRDGHSVINVGTQGGATDTEIYTETFTDLSTGAFVLSHKPTRIISVVVDEEEVQDSFYSVTGSTVAVFGLQSENESVVITYKVGGPAVTFFDGSGEEAENTVAAFGEGGATIGHAGEGHVEITKDFVRIMDGERQRAKFGGGLLIGDDNDPALRVSYGYIYFYPGQDDIQSLYFGESASIQRPLSGALKISSSVGLSLIGPTLGLSGATLVLDNNSGTAQSFAMANVITMLSTASANLTRGSAAASWSDGIVRKSGKVVTMTINSVKLASALASGSTSPTIATIPTGYRPANLQRGVAAIGTTGNYGNVWFVASNTGNVAIANRSQSSIPTTAEIHMQITYVIA